MSRSFNDTIHLVKQNLLIYSAVCYSIAIINEKFEWSLSKSATVGIDHCGQFIICHHHGHTGYYLPPTIMVTQVIGHHLGHMSSLVAAIAAFLHIQDLCCIRASNLFRLTLLHNHYLFLFLVKNEKGFIVWQISHKWALLSLYLL